MYFLKSFGDTPVIVFTFCRNCLFRALGDQLEGHSRGHLRLRQETVQYMMSHRQDFEPFVEDDVPFSQHCKCLIVTALQIKLEHRGHPVLAVDFPVLSLLKAKLWV